MSAPSGDVADRLERLAAHAPAAGVDPDRLWSTGRRHQGLRWAAAVACAAVLAGVGALAAAPVARLVQPPIAARSDGAWVLPDVVGQPSGWAPAFGPAPGPLSAVGLGSRSGWTGSRDAFWAVSALTGGSRWLDVPTTTSGDWPALSADGSMLAYWASDGPAAIRDGDPLRSPTELRVRDLETGEEQRWVPSEGRALATGGLAWAGQTLWFDAGAFLDADQTSARLTLHTWTWGTEPRDVSDLLTSRIDLTSVTPGTRGFLAGEGTAGRRAWRATSSGDLARLLLDTDGTVSSPAMSPDGSRVAGIQQGRRQQTYGVAHPLLVGEVSGGRVVMDAVPPVEAAHVLGWRSRDVVVVASPSDDDGNGEPDSSQVSVVDLSAPGGWRFTRLIDVQGPALPRFAADAWSARVVAAPDPAYAPDQRLVAGAAAVLALLLVAGWRRTRSRRGRP